MNRFAVLLSLTFLTSAAAQTLPPGPHLDVVLQKCQSCHTTARISSRPRDRAAWAATVARMKANGMDATDAEIEQMVTYLATALGTKQETPAATPAKTPTYVTSDAAKKTAVLTVVAGQGDDNNGLNFNGAAKGEKTFTVPLGWTVEVKFSNTGKMPHSLVVVPGPNVPTSVTASAAAFRGAASSVVQAGGDAVSFRFTANKAGTYLLACGVGRHATGGQYLRLVVTDDVKEATYRDTPATR